MKWLELSVRAPPEFVEPLSQIFYRYGEGGVALEVEGGFNPDEGEVAPVPDWVTIKTYLPVNSTTRERRGRIDVGVALVAQVSDISALAERELEEEEWENSWKKGFQPLRVGKRTIVCPTWLNCDAGESDIVIRLDPGMAFGTGHHPTTRTCLRLLEDLVSPGATVLDVGCGSGILSIAASKLGASGVFGLEIDSAAVGVANQNTRENGVAHRIRIAQGTLPCPDVAPLSIDVAVANISAKVVSEIAGDLLEAVRPGGAVIVSGILRENQDGPREALAAVGLRLDDAIVEDDWVTLVGSKP